MQLLEAQCQGMSGREFRRLAGEFGQLLAMLYEGDNGLKARNDIKRNAKKLYGMLAPCPRETILEAYLGGEGLTKSLASARPFLIKICEVCIEICAEFANQDVEVIDKNWMVVGYIRVAGFTPLTLQ